MMRFGFMVKMKISNKKIMVRINSSKNNEISAIVNSENNDKN